jgi:hypothetical protein
MQELESELDGELHRKAEAQGKLANWNKASQS